jgi:putative Mg2+ transporter-C (MgtC) family protein
MLDLSFPPLDMALRIAAAVISGLVLGVERESRGRAAGLRTFVLVCSAASIAMIIANVGTGTWRPDPGRVAQGLLAGMGFLGAGTILRLGTLIRGLTTSAGLWFATVLGIAFGSGYFIVGGIGLFFALFTLLVLPHLEKHINIDRYATLVVTLLLEGTEPERIRHLVELVGAKVVREDLSYDLPLKQKTVELDLHYHTSQNLREHYSQALINQLLKEEGVQQVKWTQQN